MKEILSGITHKGESGMKKTLVIAVLALALMLAFGAAPAFAKYAGFSSTMQYVDWTVAASMASKNVDSATETFGPHSGFATTTIKCAVCHSVHRAETSLLTKGAGCAYCHTTSFYGGIAAGATVSWKVTAVGTSGGGPHSSFSGCGGGGAFSAEGCHAGPHGVGASAYAGASLKLLETEDTRLADMATANGLTVPLSTGWTANMRVLATDATCVRCHTNSTFGVITAGAEGDADLGGSVGVIPVTGHRVIAAARDAGAAGWNASGVEFPTNKTGIKVAWKASTYCNSCHDLTDDNNSGKPAFPHAINDVVSTAQGKVAGNRAAVWLTAGADSLAQSKVVSGYNQYAAVAGRATPDGAAGSTLLDGICLKCHRGSATSGIGVDF